MMIVYRVFAMSEVEMSLSCRIVQYRPSPSFIYKRDKELFTNLVGQ